MGRLLTVIAVLLAVAGRALGATDHGFWVGGVRVKSDNCSNIRSGVITVGSGGHLYYTESDNTLYVKNVTIDRDGKDHHAIENTDNVGLKIVFEGTNLLKAADASSLRVEKNTTVTCRNGGTVKIEGKDEDGVCPYNGATLTVTNANLDISASNSSGIEGGTRGDAGGKIIIENSTVKCHGKTASIRNMRSVTVKGQSYVDLTMSTTNPTVQEVNYFTLYGPMDFLQPEYAYLGYLDSQNTYGLRTTNGPVKGTVLLRPTAIAINSTNFPDDVFRSWVNDFCDSNHDGYVQNEDRLTITEIKLTEKSIYSLKGIEYFTNLAWLNCSENHLTSLDVTKNTKLTYLRCFDNRLTSLDVTKNTQLTRFECTHNQLTSLDVSKNTLLTDLYCVNNKLTSIDVSKNTLLEDFRCFNNKISTLDVSKNTLLDILQCGENLFTSIDVTKNTRLKIFGCRTSNLTSIDVSKNTLLEALYCSGNSLTSLDVSNNPELQIIDCSKNQLNNLDTYKNKKLKELYIYGNHINYTRMDNFISSLPTVSEGTFMAVNDDDLESDNGNRITHLQVETANAKGWTVTRANHGEYFGLVPGQLIDENLFPDPNFRERMKGKGVDANQDGYLDNDEVGNVKEIRVNDCNIASLEGIKYFTSIETLNCSHNQLTSLDLSRNTKLVNLYCGYNKLTTLDLSKNTKLKELECCGNQLTTLNLTTNKKLNQLWCYHNNIKGTGMNTLVNSLPQTTDGQFYVLWGADDTHNAINFEQVMTARQKGWHVLICINYDWVDYRAQDTPTGVTDAERLNNNEQSTNDRPRYNLYGQRVGQDYKGVVVEDGKKKFRK